MRGQGCGQTSCDAQGRLSQGRAGPGRQWWRREVPALVVSDGAVEKPCFTDTSRDRELCGGVLLGVGCRHREASGSLTAPEGKQVGAGRGDVLCPLKLGRQFSGYLPPPQNVGQLVNRSLDLESEQLSLGLTFLSSEMLGSTWQEGALRD